MARNNRNRNQPQKENKDMSEDTLKEEVVAQEATEMPDPITPVKERAKAVEPQREIPKQQEAVKAPVTIGVSQVSDLEKKLVIYVEGMNKKQDVHAIGKIQHGLFLTLRGLLNKEDPEDFRKSWNALLSFANKNKEAAFNTDNAFRAAEAWPSSALEFTLFRRLMWVIMETANVKTRREAIKAISLKSLTEGLKEKERNNLLNFYE